MIENKSEAIKRSRTTYEMLENHVRMKAQELIQEILNDYQVHSLTALPSV